jgi:hypothetical protein
MLTSSLLLPLLLLQVMWALPSKQLLLVVHAC